MRALAVLMWKHTVVRIRKFIHTAVDLLSPIFFFAILFAFKTEINAVPQSVMIMDQTQNTETIPLTGNPLMETLKTVLYYPQSPATDSLMAEVGKKLEMDRLDQFPETFLPRGYYGYSEAFQLLSLSKRMNYMDAVIIFENLEGDKLPTNLNYTIRMKRDFHTEGYESIDGVPGPHRNFGNDYLGFMRLQWAIDSSYIEAQSQKPINQTVSVREFPYYMMHKNQIMQTVCQMLQFMCFISLLLTFVFLMCRMLEERASGIQELIKMVGVSLNTLGLSHFLNVLPCGLVFSITGAILLKVTSEPLLPNSNGFLIFLMLLLYFTTIVALAFVCSYIITSTEFATTVAVLAYGVLITPASVVMQYHMPYVVTLLTGFLPHVPMFWFWNNASILEIYGSGVTFSTMFKSTYKNGSVFLSMVYLLMQAVLFFGLAWYLSLVRPGKYGQALPWDFIFKREPSRCMRRIEPREDTSMGKLINEEYFEEPPQDTDVGIRVECVTKEYPNQTALKNVSLKAYKGEITVLVGHNGAGKTTLMSIITGMTSATEGNVYVKEFDSVAQKEQVRKLIGLCPQHNMFFPDLNLQEHIMFFTMLKRGSHQDAKHSSQKLAQQLGVDDKLNNLCSTLSGGMKRRAQLACALAGDAEVLVLDEPTSGLDVETRRELWDLLLSLRYERTVLLSTHFMEEADALGDRVAALHAGELCCFATTMHLKKAIGNGYRLSLTTSGLPKESAITEEVITHVPDATLKEKTINSISYNLPASSNNLFPNLFSALEDKKSEFNIDSIGVGVSTMEEVFLKLCSDVDTTVMENGVENTVPEPTKHKLTGFPLYWRQLVVLLKRHIRFAFYKKWIFLILQVILPITLICLLTNLLNNSNITEDVGRPLKLDMNIYTNRYTRTLYNLQQDDVIRNFNKEYSGIYFEKVDDVAQTIYNIGKRDMLAYNEYISGVEWNDTHATVLFTTTVRHAAPVTLNMLSNLFAMQQLKDSNGRITTYVHPIEGYVRHIEVKVQPKTLTAAIIWAIAITFLIQTTNLHCVSLPCRERETGSRHIHIMSGCPAELHWMATLLFHITLTTVFLIVPGVIAAYTLDKDSTINQADFLLCFAVVMFVGSLALYAFMYLVSFSFSERNTNVILVACIFIFGLVLPIIKAVYDLLNTSGETNYGVMYVILLICSYTAPPYAMITSMFQSIILARLNTFCDLSRDQCPRLFINELGWDNTADVLKCCAGEQPKCYFCINDSSPMFYIFILIAQFFVLMIMVFLTERGIFNGLFDTLKNITYKRQEPQKNDQMVRAERTYVEAEINRPPNDIKKDSMLVDDIHKNYAAIFKRSCNAVKGVSFSVKKGECFGLLGVNGAGKSTTFKMLTADECTTRGRIFANGYHLRTGTSKYLQTLGYCPQFFGLDMFQTGQENLELILTLRGFNQQQVKEELNAWIEVVGLEKYARRKVESYSGGCIRRLGAAAALCGGSDLTLLDEPSAGVDVAARRRLWTALRKALKQQRSIVITSHSMDEMETLCSRIAIMCEGRIRALGSPAALRADHAAGHALVFKVKHGTSGDQVDGGRKDSLNLLKGKLREKFKCNLKDEHKTMLHYHINETMRYSELFAELEALRDEFPNVIEDYSVTETTLEEVFLSFAKENKEGPTEV